MSILSSIIHSIPKTWVHDLEKMALSELRERASIIGPMIAKEAQKLDPDITDDQVEKVLISASTYLESLL